MSLFDTGIRPVVDQWLLDKAKENRDYGDYWSASQAGYCQRKVIFERLGVPHIETEADARKQRIFTAGHLFHDWLQNLTRYSGLSIAQEVELQDEDLMVRGHFDDLVLVGKPSSDISPHLQPGTKDGFMETKPQPQVVNILDNSHLILYDYKTVNSKSFAYKKDTMSHYHRMQLGTYMYMLRNLAWAELERRK